MDLNLKNVIISDKKKGKNIFHPLSAIITIATDVVFFGADVITLGLDLPVSIALAGSLTLIATFLVQKFINNDNIGESLAKSVFLGIAAGIPFPIAGGVVGLFILGSAGLKNFSQKDKLK